MIHAESFAYTTTTIRNHTPPGVDGVILCDNDTGRHIRGETNGHHLDRNTA